jgi:hypothetical protein
MSGLDEHFMESLQRELGDQKREVQWHHRILMVMIPAVLLVGGAYGAWALLYDPNAGRQLPPELPPPSPQASLPVSEKAKQTGKSYYEEHTEIQSALADYARRITKQALDVQALGQQFQPVANFTWDKWYFDTVPVREGFKTLKDPKPTAHSYTEDHALITYTITDDDKWGAWGVGIKYAEALGVDITNPSNKEIASLVAAYVWLQSENRLLYEKTNYFDDKDNYDPKKYQKNINWLRAGDIIRFPHLTDQALKELAQAPQKYLEGNAPSIAPVPQPAAQPPAPITVPIPTQSSPSSS